MSPLGLQLLDSRSKTLTWEGRHHEMLPGRHLSASNPSLAECKAGTGVESTLWERLRWKSSANTTLFASNEAGGRGALSLWGMGLALSSMLSFSQVPPAYGHLRASDQTPQGWPWSLGMGFREKPGLCVSTRDWAHHSHHLLS